MNKASEVVGIIVFAFGGILGLVLLRGLVLADLWLWFVVPLGVSAIGIAHAIGLSGIAALLMMGIATEKGADDDLGPWAKVSKSLVKGVVFCLFGWGAGAIAHGFM